MAEKEIIYLTVKNALCNNDNETAFKLLCSYESCLKTRIIVNKAVYAVSCVMRTKNKNVDFYYYWGDCGPFSQYVRAIILEWIIPGLENQEEQLRSKTPAKYRESPLPMKSYYEDLKINENGEDLFERVRSFFELPQSETAEEDKYKYYELLASALYLYFYAPDIRERDMVNRLRVLKYEITFYNKMIEDSVRMFFERKNLILPDI
jgi:hypothetical protein